MSILSMVAHIDAQDASYAQAALAAIKGVEVLNGQQQAGQQPQSHKILLLLDLEDEDEFSASLKQIQELKALRSLSYAAHYSEEAIHDNTQF